MESASPQVEDDTDAVLPRRLAVLTGQVFTQFVVVVEPPVGALRDNEELRAAGAELLQLGHGLAAVRGVMPCESAVLPLGEVAAAATARQPDQLLVPLADDCNNGVGGNCGGDSIADFHGEPSVGQPRARLERLEPWLRRARACNCSLQILDPVEQVLVELW